MGRKPQRPLPLDTAAETPPSVEQLLGLTGETAGPHDEYRIGDLMSEFGVTARSLRFYEQRGLLKPQRRGAIRVYSSHDRRRLQLILLCKQFGFSLTEIAQIVDAYVGTSSEAKRIKDLQKVLQEQRVILREQHEGIELSMTTLEASLAALARRV